MTDSIFSTIVIRRMFVCSCVAFLQSPNILAVTGVECIKEIELPRYSFIARRSPGGTVKAIVRIGPRGKAGAVTTPNADMSLAEEVRDTLTEGASYVDSCEGQDLELIFTFKLEGKAAEYPLTTIRFQPPNHFIIVSEPKKPHILYEKDLPK